MNNEGDFFVMLTTQSGGYTPLTQHEGPEAGTLAKFKTQEEAKTGAESSVLGEHFGYEVFEIGCGL